MPTGWYISLLLGIREAIKPEDLFTELKHGTAGKKLFRKKGFESLKSTARKKGTPLPGSGGGEVRAPPRMHEAKPYRHWFTIRATVLSPRRQRGPEE